MIRLCLIRVIHNFCSTIYQYGYEDDRCISAQNFKQRIHRGNITGNHKRPQRLGKVAHPHKRAQVPGLPNIGNASPHHHWAPRKVKFCIYILTWETDFKYLPFTSRDSLALKEVHNQLGHKQITDFISTD